MSVDRMLREVLTDAARERSPEFLARVDAAREATAENRCEGCDDTLLAGCRWPTASNCDETRNWIERCDLCERFDNDYDAAVALVTVGLIGDFRLARPIGSISQTPYSLPDREAA